MKDSLRVRPLIVLLALLLAGASTNMPAVQAQGAAAAVPSPVKFFGFEMGADRKLANWDKLHEYYQALAKASNKMRVVELGKTIACEEGSKFAIREGGRTVGAGVVTKILK